jgi:hypothetical protein
MLCPGNDIVSDKQMPEHMRVIWDMQSPYPIHLAVCPCTSQADALEGELVRMWMRFLMQRADNLPILRRVPLQVSMLESHQRLHRHAICVWS